MTIFRFSVFAFLGLLGATVHAEPVGLTPRNNLEAIVLGEAETAHRELQALIDQNKEDHPRIAQMLLQAGFQPDRGLPGCDFYGYYRKMSADGSARTAQVALCRSGNSMVQVFNMLPPGKPGPTFKAAPAGRVR